MGINRLTFFYAKFKVSLWCELPQLWRMEFLQDKAPVSSLPVSQTLFLSPRHQQIFTEHEEVREMPLQNMTLWCANDFELRVPWEQWMQNRLSLSSPDVPEDRPFKGNSIVTNLHRRNHINQSGDWRCLSA